MKNLLMWLFIAITMFSVFSNFNRESSVQELSYSEFISQVESDKVLSVDLFKDLIQDGNIIYEQPGIIELEGLLWKGKADIINHDERVIVDLKTTSDIDNFKYSASRYNYDSQAFIYSKLFGYEMIFITIDKPTHQIKICECSDAFHDKGREKVKEAVAQYKLFFKSPEFDPKQFFKTEIL